MLDMAKQFFGNELFQVQYEAARSLGYTEAKEVYKNFKDESPEKVMYRIFNHLYKGCDSLDIENQAIECKKGCNACCHLRVSVSVPEAAALAIYLRKKLSVSQLAEVQYKLDQWYNCPELLKSITWINEQKKCVFLFQGACSIYKFRPMTCRGMNSYEREKCFEGYTDRKVISHQLNGAQKFFFEGLSKGAEEFIAETYHVDTDQVELHNTLRHVLTFPFSVKDYFLGSVEFSKYKVHLTE